MEPITRLGLLQDSAPTLKSVECLFIKICDYLICFSTILKHDQHLQTKLFSVNIMDIKSVGGKNRGLVRLHGKDTDVCFPKRFVLGSTPELSLRQIVQLRYTLDRLFYYYHFYLEVLFQETINHKK